MIHPTPAELLQIARDERARRKAGWQAAGLGLSDRAQQDDIIWSNIEQMAGRAAQDPAAMKRQPWYWTAPEVDVMERVTRSTAIKAETSLDLAKEENWAKVKGLWQLYNWVRQRNPAFATLGPEYLRATRAQERAA